MRHQTPLRSLVFAVILSLTGILAARVAAADKSAAVTAVYSAKETEEFKTLTKATLDALNAGKSTEMVEKLTDLETAWDAKEAVLRKKNEKTWVSIDKTLDQAISALRSSKKDMAKGKAALEDLGKKLEQATKP
jgi:hypothetical protein